MGFFKRSSKKKQQQKQQEQQQEKPLSVRVETHRSNKVTNQESIRSGASISKNSQSTQRSQSPEEVRQVRKTSNPLTPKFISAVGSTGASTEWNSASTQDKTAMTHQPPPAREAAFTGPPRFDWIDIETAAVIKIQAIQRRNLVMKKLEASGQSTSAIRNRRRQRKARARPDSARAAHGEDAPSFFQCCAVGLAFGDVTEEDDIAYRNFQKKQYEERQKQQAVHESALRKKYMKEHGGVNTKVIEAVEVVE